MGIDIYTPQIKNNNVFIFNLNVSSQVQLLHGCFPGCSYSFFLRYFLCLQMQPNVNNQSRGHINTRAYVCWVMYAHCRSWHPQKWPKRGLVAPAWNTVCAVKRRRRDIYMFCNHNRKRIVETTNLYITVCDAGSEPAVLRVCFIHQLW